MTDAVTVNEILRFKDKNDGLRPRASAANLELVKGSETTKPFEYLNARNVYPYFVDFKKSTIYFIQTNVEIKHNEAAFIHEELQADAKYLLTASIDGFMSFCARLDLPKDPDIFFIHHASRCGSTLLHKVMASHPDIESFSEDLMLENVMENVMVDVDAETIERVFRVLVLFIAHKFAAEPHKKLVFKLSGPSFIWFDNLMKVFPRSKHIYLTRDIIEILESLISMKRASFFHRLLLRIKLYNYKLLPYSKTQAPLDRPRSPLHRLQFKDPYFATRRANRELPPFKISAAESLALYIMIKDQFFAARAAEVLNLKYQDILSVESLRRKLNPFLEFDLASGIDESCYRQHSQKNSFLNPSYPKHWKFTQREKDDLRGFVARMSEMV